MNEKKKIICSITVSVVLLLAILVGLFFDSKENVTKYIENVPMPTEMVLQAEQNTEVTLEPTSTPTPEPTSAPTPEPTPEDIELPFIPV